MFRNLTVRKLCTMAMLIALTVVLSLLSGYLRIGTAIKLSVSFVSVYIAAALLGPLAGGTVGALADVISYFINPVGAFLWPLTILEFFYGVLYGLCFSPKKKHYFRTRLSLCVGAQLLLNILAKSYVLMSFGYAPAPFGAAILVRLLPALIQAALQVIVIVIFEKFYIGKFAAMMKK